jgi:hypothetical protein
VNTHRSMALCGAVAVVVLAFGASNAVADRESGKRRLWGDDKGVRPFAATVEHAGRIGDDMVIQGIRYRMSRDVQVYFVGQGMQEQGVNVPKSLVYLAGEMRGSDVVVSLVVVRPAPSSVATDMSAHVRLRPAKAPR